MGSRAIRWGQAVTSLHFPAAPSDPGSAKTTTYAYDDLYRFTGETVAHDPRGNNGAIAYDLDKVGNRVNRNSTVSAVSSVLNQAYNARDQLGSDSYDANGNTLVGQTAGLASSPTTPDIYDFDAARQREDGPRSARARSECEGRLWRAPFGQTMPQDRLIVRHRPDGSTVNLSYDADGIRRQKTIFDLTGALISTTTYLVDTNNLTGYAQVFEERHTDATGTTLKTYTYGHDLLSVSESTPSAPAFATRYYAYDGGSSVRALTDAAGTVSAPTPSPQRQAGPLIRLTSTHSARMWLAGLASTSARCNQGISTQSWGSFDE